MLTEPTGYRATLLDLGVILALVLACYFVRPAALTVRGEESRWASEAQEMVRGGDWVVPRQQGRPFLSRPPMGSWLIAAAAAVRGEFDLVAVRLPTVLAVLGLSLLIYGYARSFLPRAGALTAAVAFPSMPEILQMGRLAESDGVFAFFLGGAFLAWHWGWSRGRPGVAWVVGYALLAGATLTKGVQAPVTFTAAVGLYLLITRQAGALFARAHLLGVLTYAALLGAWLAPFSAELGLRAAWQTLAGETGQRFGAWTWSAVLKHAALYPLEAIGCTAPWSWALLALASREFRRTLGPDRPHVLFLATCVGVGFAPCCLSPGGQTRYLMPLYPCAAVLAGVVVGRAAESAAWVRTAFARLRWVVAANMVGAAVAVAWLTWGTDRPDLSHWRQPGWFAAAVLAAAAVAAVLHWRGGPFARAGTNRAGLAAVAGFVGLMYAGVVVNQLAVRQTAAEGPVAQLKQHLPGDARLVSLGPVHHKFLYLYGSPVELMSGDPTVVPPGGYVCYDAFGGIRRPLPFPHEELAVVNMDRNRYDPPQVLVVVARRTVIRDH